MSITRAILCPNPLRDKDFSVAKAAEKVLAEKGIKTRYCLPFPGDRGTAGIPMPSIEDAIGPADIVIAFGGDGTILRLAPVAAAHKTPILGVNTGTLGFMAELEPDQVHMLRRLAYGDYRVENRTMLKAEVVRGCRTVHEATGLNDAVVTKGGDAKTIRLKAYAGNATLGTFTGDGVIVATATGSTGYSMSAGGPILDPDTHDFVVTPICAHSVFNRPFVLPSGRKIALRPENRDEKQVFLSVDGQQAVPILPDDMVVISRSEDKLPLVRLSDHTVYDILRSKMSAAP